MPIFAFDNSYVRDLAGLWQPQAPEQAPKPALLRLNRGLALELGLNPDALELEAAQIFSGARLPEGAEPIAMAYAGHQFGHLSPQLGDGRAVLLGEVIDRNGQRRDIHLKGSGRTPYSRSGDGKAVLGPVLREYLIGEAMHGLGVPTTRALAACLTGEEVLRQDGYEAGAVLTRVASSHLRVGTFEYFAIRGARDEAERLLAYAIARHDPDLKDHPRPALAFFERVMERQAALLAAWMSFGFVHGVMNTDNMTISGETIDYGPCAFMDSYDAQAVFSSIDRQGRYAFGNQPRIAHWNLARLAEALLFLITPDNPEAAIPMVTEALERFPALYEDAWLMRMRAKLGLTEARAEDQALARDFHLLMQNNGADFTNSFRSLMEDNPAASLPWAQDWLKRWQARRDSEGPQAIAAAQALMAANNPLYIPRNHLVEEALYHANQGDFAPFDGLLQRISAPYTPSEGAERYAEPAPTSFGPYRTFCGT